MTPDQWTIYVCDRCQSDAIRPALRREMSMRCSTCAGTGVSLVSNLDCTPCDASGIRSDLRGQEDAAVRRVVDAICGGRDA